MSTVREATIRTYLGAMERSDLDTVCTCFTENATVLSPVYGAVPIRPFYEKLFEDTISAAVKVRHIYCGIGSPDCWAAHFSYRWMRKSGGNIDTDLVDLFEFEGARIARLRIIFDSAAKQ